jgi:RNA polymerase sigma-70 factor (ECF subfamily)
MSGNPRMDENDEALVERYARGETEALGLLFDRYRRPLYSFVLRMSPSREEADEVFQEVWLKVIKHAKSYRKDRFRGWVFRIAHNLMIDRARCRKTDWSLDAPVDEGEDETTWVDRVASTGRSPSATLSAKELAAEIQSAVGQLAPAQREVFMLRVEGNVPFKEIAKIQRVPINTALARMQYAVNRLRRMLPREAAVEEDHP